MGENYKRLIILNRMLSVSATRAKEKDEAPIHGGYELFKLLEARVKEGVAVEFFEADRDEDDRTRIKNSCGSSYIKMREIAFSKDELGRYVSVLIEFLNKDERSMPVVSMSTFSGRELSGEEDERGAYTAHLVVRFPQEDEYDDASYRAAVEINNISRKSIEHLLCRQLRRVAGEEPPWTFPVWKQLKTKKKQEDRRYHPKLQFVADIGRSLDLTVGTGGALSQMIFTKRHEKQNTAGPTAVVQTEFYANISVRVSASQGPTDPDEKMTWFSQLRRDYLTRGYECRTYFRHAKGGLVSGDVSDEIAGATDIVMCQKEYVALSSEPARWCSGINSEIVGRLKSLLNNDGLWVRGQPS